MADHRALAASALCLPDHPVVGDGVTLSPAPEFARFSLRARTATALAETIGRPVPERIGEVSSGIACFGPDEWYALLPAGTALPSRGAYPVSIVDISARAAGVIVAGPRTTEVLSSGCPIDIARLRIGHAARGIYETVEIGLWRESEARIHVEVVRSFAPWLWHVLARNVG
jgi:sarcosine oxidase subunit gamma